MNKNYKFLTKLILCLSLLLLAVSSSNMPCCNQEESAKATSQQMPCHSGSEQSSQKSNCNMACSYCSLAVFFSFNQTLIFDFNLEFTSALPNQIISFSPFQIYHPPKFIV